MSEKNRFAKKRKIEQQAEIWFDGTDDRVPFNVFSDQQEKISVGEEMLEAIRRKISFRKSLIYWSRMAAAAVLLLTVGIVSYQSYQSSTAVTLKQDWVSYTAALGEFKQIVLPDSSVIHLRPGATVSITKPFIQKIREVKLQKGEVYFEVSHDPSHPFLVRTGQMITEVLGTKFIINNDPLLADIRVALLSGKVVVRNQKAELGVLLPHQQLSYNRDNETVNLESSSTHVDKWLNGEYVLEDVPLKLFAQSFGNAFAMEVKFKQQSLENLYVSIRFNRGDRPEDILDQLKLIHRLHYEIKDKEVILMK